MVQPLLGLGERDSVRGDSFQKCGAWAAYSTWIRELRRQSFREDVEYLFFSLLRLLLVCQISFLRTYERGLAQPQIRMPSPLQLSSRPRSIESLYLNFILVFCSVLPRDRATSLHE